MTAKMIFVRDVILFNAGAIIQRILKWLSMIFTCQKETGSANRFKNSVVLFLLTSLHCDNDFIPGHTVHHLSK